MKANNDDDLDQVRKSSTMNSMYIGSTINKPNVESIIQAVATILHSQMLEVSIMITCILIYFFNHDTSYIGSKLRKINRKRQ